MFFRSLLAVCTALIMCSCADKHNPADDKPMHTIPEKEETAPPTDYTSELTVMSFNVRYPASSDTGQKAWSTRLPAVISMLKEKQPDLLGVQECYYSQRADILKSFPTWKYYGVSRASGKDTDSAAETTSILYNASRFKLIDCGTFWLSETPDTPSTGWGATIKRSTTWILFEEIKTGKRFYHVNTHLDHASAQAQEEGAKLIRTRVTAMNKNKYPVVLTGDMNVAQVSAACNNFQMKNARTTAKSTDNGITCHGYGSKTQQIDHIFYEGFYVESFRTVVGQWNGLNYISDHSPVMAEFKF